MNKITITKGNTKTRIPSFNLLAGDKMHAYSGAAKSELKANINVCGTCSGDCPGCYAKRSTRFDNVFIAYARNTISAYTDPAGTIAEIETQLYSGRKKAPHYFRIHDSGDFFAIDYFCEWVAMATRHPETKFYCYTKEAEIINAYGADNLPKNFTVLCSPWPGVCEPIADLPQFIYDNGTDAEIAKLPHCPAVDKNGKRTGVTCAQCGYCPTAKRGSRRAVYAH